MNLYIWTGMINNERYIIYSLANDLPAAMQLAVDKAPTAARDTVNRIVNANTPIIHDEPTSFIQGSHGQLV